METIETLDPTPFKHLVMSIGALPTSFVDGMSYYECMAWLVAYIRDNVVPACNNNAEAIKEIQEWIETLDLQDEVDNKLDEMAESGELAEIIAQYLNANVILAYDSVADMKSAENLVNGSLAETYGFYAKGDGGSAKYIIRNVTNADTIDEMTIIALADETLVAQLIVKPTVNVKQFGAKGDGVNNDVTAIQCAIDTVYSIGGGEVFIPDGKYICNSSITCKNNVHIIGDFGYNYVGNVDKGLCFNNTNGFTGSYRNRFTNLIIQNIGNTPTGTKGIITNGGIVTQCTISGFAAGIDCAYNSVTAEKCNFHANTIGVYNPNDARIMNCTFNANTNHAINMQTGASDNIIIGNKIEWNGAAGINCNHADNNVISNNILDRNSSQGVSCTSSKNIVISGNMLRRNGVTSSGSDKVQIRIDSCEKITISNNTVGVGNSQDDGSGTLVPTYALKINNSSYVLSIGNNYHNGGTNSDPLYINGNTNTQLLDQGFVASSYLTGSALSGEVASSGTLELHVPGAMAGTNDVPYLQKVNYQFRRTDKGSYEGGEFILSNFRTWGNASSTSAKTSVSSFISGNITLAVSYDVTNGYYVLTFTNTDASHNYTIKVTPIDI